MGAADDRTAEELIYLQGVFSPHCFEECAQVFRRDIRKRRCLTNPTEGKGEFMHRYAEDKRERVAYESLAHL